MNTAQSVSAAFNAAPKAMISLIGYSSFASAYVAALGPVTTIMLLEDTLQLSTTINKSLVVQGGYNADFTRSTNGYTTLRGTLTIGTGKLTVDRVILK
jgi:hypothetical protein